MTEYYTVKRIDNSRLSRPIASAHLKEFLRRIAMAGAMALLLLTYAWQHFACIQMRYQIEQLQTNRRQAVELNQQLHLEVETLRAPGRVDDIGRTELGLTVPVPGLANPGEAASDAVLAQARAVIQAPRP
jgi:cell division protein FtsL